MPPIYKWFCKLCKEWGGGDFNHAIRSIDFHLQRVHHIRWRDHKKERHLREFVEELKKILPLLEGEKGIVQVNLKEGVVIYDKVEKAWTFITPLFEVAPYIVVSERGREEARREKERLKERVKEEEWKRWKYRKRYYHYHQKYYEDYFKTKSLHTFASLNLERAKHMLYMRLWYEYNTLKAEAEDTPHFKEVREKLKKHRLHYAPATFKKWLSARLSRRQVDAVPRYYLLCKSCPYRHGCKVSSATRRWGDEEILREAGCVFLQKRHEEKEKLKQKMLHLTPSS